MKSFIALSALLLSTQAFSAVVTKKLQTKEINFALNLINKYEIPAQGTDTCHKTEFDIKSRVRGFNPANWSLISGEASYKLEGEEIQKAIALANRLEIPHTKVDSITTEKRVTIVAEVCGYNAERWTATFENQQ